MSLEITSLGVYCVLLLVAADKVHKKAENINERRNANRDRALQQMEKLKDQLQLHQFLQVR
jgi:hypothetical protein